MSLFFPARNGTAAFQRKGAVAKEHGLRDRKIVFHGNGGNKDLEQRSRRIGRKRFVDIGIGGKQIRHLIRIVFRSARHGQNIAVFAVQNDHSAAVTFKSRFRRPLNTEIHGQQNLSGRIRFLFREIIFTGIDHAVALIHQETDFPRASRREDIIVNALQTAETDDLTAVFIFAQSSQQMLQREIAVVTPLTGNYVNAAETQLFYVFLFFGREIRFGDKRFPTDIFGLAVYFRHQPFRGKPRVVFEETDGFFHITDERRHDQQRSGLRIGGHGNTVAVRYAAPG